MLWMFQRVIFGPVTHAENEKLTDLTLRERLVFAPLLVLIFWMASSRSRSSTACSRRSTARSTLGARSAPSARASRPRRRARRLAIAACARDAAEGAAR